MFPTLSGFLLTILSLCITEQLPDSSYKLLLGIQYEIIIIF